jgi:hypothetical protein
MIMFAIAFGIGLGALKKAGHGDLWQVNTLESVLSQVRYLRFIIGCTGNTPQLILIKFGYYLVLILVQRYGRIVLFWVLKKPTQA